MKLYDVDKLDISMGDDLHARYEAVSEAYKFHKEGLVSLHSDKDKVFSLAEIELVEELCIHNSTASH